MQNGLGRVRNPSFWSTIHKSSVANPDHVDTDPNPKTLRNGSGSATLHKTSVRALAVSDFLNTAYEHKMESLPRLASGKYDHCGEILSL